MIHFLLGFITAGALCASLVAIYYVRARKRVRSIQQAIKTYQESSKAVNAATKDIYEKKP